MDTLLLDVRYGIRQLLRQRGSSIVAILTLALGMGASTAIFSVADATLLRPIPYPHPEELVTLLVEVDDREAGRLAGSGLLIVNPPWTLQAELAQLVPALAAIFEAPSPARLDWVTPAR